MKNKREQKLSKMLDQKINEVFQIGELLNNNPELFAEEDFKKYSDILKSLEYLDLVKIIINEENNGLKIIKTF